MGALMRWLLLAVFAACLALSVNMRPSGASVLAAATIEPWESASAEQFSLDLSRARGNQAGVEIAAAAANRATVRAGLNLVGWGCFVISLFLGRRRALKSDSAREQA
jgi:hypothetical protein